MRSPIKNKVAYIGVMLSFALILSYIETLISFDSIFPGIKLGLSNFIVVITIYVFGPLSGFILGMLKAVITSLLFGNLTTMIYSISGTVLSFTIMYLLYRSEGFHIPVISAAGGVSHNIGQFLAAVLIMKTFVPGVFALYIAILIASGLVSGLITGFIAQICLPYIKKAVSKGDQI